ncbi:MAG: hypothetical protein ACLTG4_00965 [Oscillospiraceae bacterium]
MVPVTGTTAGIIPALTAGEAGFPALDVLGVSYPALDSQSRAGLRRAPEGHDGGLHVHEAGAARGRGH